MHCLATRSACAGRAAIRSVIDRWSDPEHPGAVLGHGAAEHALEAHLLSGRLALHVGGSPLRSVIPNATTLRAAQFPTLWGNVTRPARYLDALLADPSESLRCVVAGYVAERHLIALRPDLTRLRPGDERPVVTQAFDHALEVLHG